MTVKKNLTLVGVLGVSAMMLLAGCGGGEKKEAPKASFDKNKEITVVSRENGSGTRGAFVELTGVEIDSNYYPNGAEIKIDITGNIKE